MSGLPSTQRSSSDAHRPAGVETATSKPEHRVEAHARGARAVVGSHHGVPLGRDSSRWLPVPFSVRIAATVYLAVFIIIELAATYTTPSWGVIGQSLLVGVTLIRAALSVTGQGDRRLAVEAGTAIDILPNARLWTALALPPLLRLIALGLPEDIATGAERFGAVAFALLIAAWLTVRACEYHWFDVELRFNWSRRGMATDLSLGALGSGIGFIAFQVLDARPLLTDWETPSRMVAIGAMFLATGLAQELVFRGVLQRAARDVWGPWAGIVYQSLFFAAVHIGHRSVASLALALATGVLFGLIVHVRQSLLGVILASAIASYCFYVVFPLL